MRSELEVEKRELEKRLKEIELEEKRTKRIKGSMIRRKVIDTKSEESDIIKNVDNSSEYVDNNLKTNSYDYRNKKTNSNYISFPILIVIVILVAIASSLLGVFLVLSNTSTTTTSGGVTTSTVALKETNSISDAVEKVYDGTVVVEGYSNQQLSSTGTGFVYKKTGNKAYIMTNSHVISNCDTIKVLFNNGDEVATKVVGSDTYSDIAVLSVDDSSKIVATIMGDSSKSKVGDTVFTVGSPEGSDYAGTVTKGVLSAKDRLVEVALSSSSSSDYYMNVLQTDAAINPGNSGGPLCNTNGEVIGITNMKLVDDSVEGMGFAIPIEDALSYAEVLEKEGKIVRPYIGISMLDLSNSFYLWQAGINLPSNVDSGVVVYNVESNSPASKAGLQKGDVITKIGDKDVSSLAEFRYELYKLSPNDKVKINYVRNGKEESTTVELGKGE